MAGLWPDDRASSGECALPPPALLDQVPSTRTRSGTAGTYDHDPHRTSPSPCGSMTLGAQREGHAPWLRYGARTSGVVTSSSSARNTPRPRAAGSLPEQRRPGGPTVPRQMAMAACPGERPHPVPSLRRATLVHLTMTGASDDDDLRSPSPHRVRQRPAVSPTTCRMAREARGAAGWEGPFRLNNDRMAAWGNAEALRGAGPHRRGGADRRGGARPHRRAAARPAPRPEA